MKLVSIDLNSKIISSSLPESIMLYEYLLNKMIEDALEGFWKNWL